MWTTNKNNEYDASNKYSIKKLTNIKTKRSQISIDSYTVSICNYYLASGTMIGYALDSITYIHTLVQTYTYIFSLSYNETGVYTIECNIPILYYII